MKSRTVFPVIVRPFYLPHADESVARHLFAEFSPVSQRNFQALQRIFGIEVGTRQMSFGYSAAATDGRWMLFANTGDTDEVIGYAACLVVESFGQTHGLITDLAVLPEYRHQGVAQSLIAGVSAIFTVHQDPRVTTLAAIVPAPRQAALDTFVLAGFENVVQGEEYLFRLSINRSAVARR